MRHASLAFPPMIFLTPLEYGNLQRVARGDSTKGAKEGPYRMCTGNTQNGVCGPPTFATVPGDIKFSMMGYHKGSDIDLTLKKGTNGIPAGTTHIGIRTKVSAEGIDITRMKVLRAQTRLRRNAYGSAQHPQRLRCTSTTIAW